MRQCHSRAFNWSLYLFPWQQPESIREACHFDVACAVSSGLAALRCACTVLEVWKEFIKHIKCSNVIAQCECECLWGCWSAQRAGWKVNCIQEFPGQGTLESWPSRPCPFLIAFCVCCLLWRLREREYICGQNSLTWRCLGKNLM